MAKRKGGNGGFHMDKTMWLIVGGLGGMALYLMLLGRDTGFKPADTIIRDVGDFTDLEGAGKGYIPDFLGPVEKAAMYADDEGGGDMDITVA
jgi:hypothetical protein